jgi:hypothetical protein
MASKRLSRAERMEQTLKSLQARLPSSVAGAVGELAHGKPPSAFGLLRAWRRLGRAADIAPHDRNVLRQSFVNAFTRLLHEAGTKGGTPFMPADFGVHGYRELADLFVTMLERVGYAKASLSKLRRIRSMMVGELLEVLVRNSRELQPGLLGMAEAQLRILRRPGTALVDARGAAVAVPKAFEAPVKAIDIVITGSGAPRKFFDLAYVSLGEWPDGKQFITFLVETEIKMPTAARKAGRQVGRAQVRFDMEDGDELVVNVAGKGPLKFRADQIVFAPTSIDRTLVSIGNTEQFKLRSTRAGGYDETFWQVDLEMKATSLRRLVDLAVP